MVRRPFIVIASAVLLAGLPGPAWSQATTASTARGISLEPGASAEPDPLTPAEVHTPAPAAPGVPATAIEAKPVDTLDPIVALVRQKLAAAPLARAGAADRDDHAGLAAFYAAHGSEPLWVGKEGFTARALQAMAEIRKADDWGLKASAFELPSPPEASATAEMRAETEVKLGIAVLKYARHARGGRVDPPSISRILDRKPTIYDPKTVMQGIAAASAPDAYLRDLHPKHPQFELLRQALLAARGARQEDAPAPSVTIPVGPLIKPGQEHEHVALLRQRLALPTSDGKDQLHDAALVEALKAFQGQHGLEASGSLNAATRNALNGSGPRPASENIQRLVVNMERWRWMPVNLGNFYVWDSIPDQMTSVYKNGKPILSEKIVVGRPTSPTPIFTADMLLVIFHPSWGVPSGIKVYELLPQLKNAGGGGWFFSSGASAVLQAHGLQLSKGGVPVNPDSVNWATADIRSYDFTQPPGPKNLLGIVKFRFPNKHDVYMHDTPERHLFGGATRVFSHGCMRVQNPIRLAEVLLEHDKGWSTDKVQEYVRRGGEIKLTTPIPVHITYFTAVADDAGKITYRPDVYGLDGRIASALEGRTVHLIAASTDTRPPSPAKGERVASKKSRSAEKAPAASTFNPFSGQSRY